MRSNIKILVTCVDKNIMPRPYHILTLILCSLLFINNGYSAESCDTKVQNLALNKAITKCKLKLSAKMARDLQENLLSEISNTNYCQYQASENLEKIDQRLCRDPNGFVCQNKGNFFDSECHFTAIKNKGAMSYPSYVKALCEGEKEWRKQELPNGSRGLCAINFIMNTDECVDFISLRNPIEKARIMRSKVYTKKRITKVQDSFDLAKTSLIEIIKKSTKLDFPKRMYLISKIKSTKLGLDPEDLEDPLNSDCYNPSPAKLSVTAFNADVVERISEFKKVIRICSGLMAGIDNMNPYVLIQLLAHELSHSIDPCALETYALENRMQDKTREQYQIYFPDTVNCLRGTTKAQACEAGVLNCQSDDGIKQYCSKDTFFEDKDKCYTHSKKLASCAFGAKNSDNKYLHKKDQSSEAFADFMASEVLAKVLEQEKSIQKKQDAILSLASTLSRIHDGCVVNNTNNEHPPGFLRLNRVIMSSERLRISLTCNSGPPKTKQANITCPGL